MVTPIANKRAKARLKICRVFRVCAEAESTAGNSTPGVNSRSLDAVCDIETILGLAGNAFAAGTCSVSVVYPLLLR